MQFTYDGACFHHRVFKYSSCVYVSEWRRGGKKYIGSFIILINDVPRSVHGCSVLIVPQGGHIVS